jgi:hypothetical protein
MKRFVVGSALALGCILLIGTRGLAQEHRGGWPQPGELHWTPGQDTPPAMRPEGTVTDSRFNYHNNRWWYWTAQHKLMYWDGAQWRDFAADSGSVPYASNDRGTVDANDLSGWYWRDSEKRWYLFDGKTLKPAP